jgi:hypothetical protein
VSAILACVMLWRLLSGGLSSLRWSPDVLVESSMSVAVARLSKALWYVVQCCPVDVGHGEVAAVRGY